MSGNGRTYFNSRSSHSSWLTSRLWNCLKILFPPFPDFNCDTISCASSNSCWSAVTSSSYYSKRANITYNNYTRLVLLDQHFVLFCLETKLELYPTEHNYVHSTRQKKIAKIFDCVTFDISNSLSVSLIFSKIFAASSSE